MEVVVYAEQLEGQATEVTLGVFHRSEICSRNQLRLEVEAVVSPDGSFREQGSISTPDGDELRIKTIGTGLLAKTPADGARLGCVTWEIDGGTGRWANASGRISSTFRETPDGQLTDNQHGLLFLAHTPTPKRGHP